MQTIKTGLFLLLLFTTVQCRPFQTDSTFGTEPLPPNEKFGLYLGKAKLIRQSYEETFDQHGRLQLISHLDTIISLWDTIRIRSAGHSLFRAKGIGLVSEINQWENEVYEWSQKRKYEAGVTNPGYYSNRLTFDFGKNGALAVAMNIQIHRTDQPRNWTKLEFQGRYLTANP